MASELPEFKQMNATGLNRDDGEKKEHVDGRGALDQVRPTGVMATGRKTAQRKGLYDRSTDSR